MNTQYPLVRRAIMAALCVSPLAFSTVAQAEHAKAIEVITITAADKVNQQTRLGRRQADHTRCG